MYWEVEGLGLKMEPQGFYSVVNKQNVRGPEFYERQNYTQRKKVETYEKDSEYYTWYHEILARWLQKKTSQELTILDFGCGVGHAVEGFSRSGIKALGADISIDAIKFGRDQKGRNLSLASFSDAFDLCEENKINCIYSKNCLEHLLDPSAAVNDLIRNKKVEFLCISVPNDFSLFQYEANKLVARKNWWVDTTHHANYFSHASIEKICEEFGFWPISRLGTYPLELSILGGINYVDYPELGEKVHKARVAFEENLALGSPEALLKVYEAFGEIGVGRDAVCLLKRGGEF